MRPYDHIGDDFTVNIEYLDPAPYHTGFPLPAFAGTSFAGMTFYTVIASVSEAVSRRYLSLRAAGEAISLFVGDCFVALLLAMTSTSAFSAVISFLAMTILWSGLLPCFRRDRFAPSQ